MISRGWAASTTRAITPITGALAGSHFAGRFSDGHASHSAPNTNPIRPHAAATNVPVLSLANHHANNAAINIVIDIANAIARRTSPSAF